MHHYDSRNAFVVMNKTDSVIYPVYLNKSSADLPGENWKDVPGFEGSYQASDLGRVRSLDRTI